MVKYKVIVLPLALDDVRNIYLNHPNRWSFSETDAYVAQINSRIDSLEEMPQRFDYDQHTRFSKTFRSFEYKAHKVFFTIDEESKTVNIAAILPSRTKYSVKL